MTRQPSRLAAMANSRPSSPEPSSMRVARYMAAPLAGLRGEGEAAMFALDATCRKARFMRRHAALALLLLLAAHGRRAAGQAKTPTEIVAAAPARRGARSRPTICWSSTLEGGTRVVDPARARLRAGPCRQHPRAGQGRLVDRAPRSTACRTIMSRNGAITRATSRFPAGVVAKPPAEYERAARRA